jgi:precorrin-6A/cobalt-precorrin-6A reductase
MTILILGGTREARELAAALVDLGGDVISSLAGRVSRPAVPVGRVRVGGFGGVDGLVDYLRAGQITAVVDATHPFAVRISANAAAATVLAGVPLLRLERPGWHDHPQAGTWTWVADAAAARDAAEYARRPFLTTGRQSLDAFLPWTDRRVIVRVVDPPEITVPATWTVIRSRGPYPYDEERRLLEDHAVDVLITKDSGGDLTRAKLDAAADLGVTVVIISRPAPDQAVPSVDQIAIAVNWARARGAHRGPPTDQG